MSEYIEIKFTNDSKEAIDFIVNSMKEMKSEINRTQARRLIKDGSVTILRKI